MQAQEQSTKAKATLGGRREPALPRAPSASAARESSHREAANGCSSRGAQARLLSVSPRVRQGSAFPSLSTAGLPPGPASRARQASLPRDRKEVEEESGHSPPLLHAAESGQVPRVQKLHRQQVAAGPLVQQVPPAQEGQHQQLHEARSIPTPTGSRWPSGSHQHPGHKLAVQMQEQMLPLQLQEQMLPLSCTAKGHQTGTSGHCTPQREGEPMAVRNPQIRGKM